MALVPVTVHLRNGVQVTVTGQQLSEHFAVTPSLAIGEDGTVGLADYGRALTHIPSGRAVTHDTLFDFAGLVTELEALPIDWAAFTQPTTEQAEAIKAAYWRNATAHTPAWPWPEWAGDENEPALSLLGTLLDDGAKDARRGELVAKLTARATELDPAFGEELGNHLRWMLAGIHSSNYGEVWLLAVLHRIDPAAADRAATDLAAALDSGDALGEWICQWRQELADGNPLTLHGFPDLPTPAAV